MRRRGLTFVHHYSSRELALRGRIRGMGYGGSFGRKRARLSQHEWSVRRGGGQNQDDVVSALASREWQWHPAFKLCCNAQKVYDHFPFTFLPYSVQDVTDSAGAIAALVSSATHDENPDVSLDEIYSALCQSRSESNLDPLSILPSLLPCRQLAAKNLISLIGECGNAKEVMIAVQEVLEQIDSALDLELEEDDEEDNDRVSPSEQLISIIHLCNSAIPRLKLRKKSPSETIRPVLSQLQSTIQLAGSRLGRNQGRETIISVSQLSQNVISWATGLKSEDAAACQEILKSLLDTAVSECSHCIQSSLAQRSFETLYPRLTVRSTISLGWEGGEEAIKDALTVYSSFGQTFDSLPPVPSTAHLILLSHSKIVPSDICRALLFMLPILVASIQANHTLDETLSLLLQWLHPSHFLAGEQLSPDISGPLCALLPTLASAHPDADIRHQAFRILSQCLSLTSSELRLRVLQELTTDAEFPQMRVAAVGLVKEASLESLLHEDKPNIFASPFFLQVFGPILFRPDPVDFFRPDLSLSEIEDSLEPARLVECLSLYYVLLLRDNLNRTGIRDPDQIFNIERALLAPLRATVSRWMEGPTLSDEHMHAIMPVVSLKTSLERVDAAIIRLRPSS
ncbi:hypothetical protein MVEN_01340000 [Mycena venus]|uniref:Uncharacterized protein n=1 Tax=Mycena venus TaxID=2733690 RepID=A0A8H7CWX3_9AGAR|nr:hypothetical protein MVEN_01340000 [Mycena venus]